MPETDLAKPVVSTNGKAEDPPLTILAKGDSMQGHVVIKGDGHLLGKFRGEIDCAGELLVGPEADLAANIRTERITIAGFVRGTITATGRLKIAPSGRLEGDARVGSLVVQEGGVHHGVIRVHPEGLPVEEEPLLESSEEPVGVVAAKPAANPVDRVKKLWGEFF
jgi:cytoskeletal protein CcmA (bactofilin family)